MFSEKADDETFVKCASCKCTRGNQFFTSGLMSCDRCIDHKKAYNKKKSEENRLNNPSTFCEICQRYSKDDRWEEHLNFKRHKLGVLLLEFEEEMANAMEEEKEQLQKEQDKRLKELTDYYEDLRQKELKN